jgi:riboflavin biosynthesis pyrimidine reductase
VTGAARGDSRSRRSGRRRAREQFPALAPFELLSDTSGLPAYQLPARLEATYAGSIGFDAPAMVANFVSSVDGVTSLGAGHPSPGSIISGHSLADRFLMGLLRACADAVVIGAGTLRDTPGHRWTPDHVYPAAAEDFAVLRRELGRGPSPRLVVVTASGDIDLRHPGVERALILTTDAGAVRLGGQVPDGVEVRSLGGVARLSMGRVVEEIRKDGHQVILTEGGPSLLGQLLQEELVDELFLTLAPVLLGRAPAEDRPGLVAGVAFDADAAPVLSMLSVRRHGSLLFLRYGVAHGSQSRPADV